MNLSCKKCSYEWKTKKEVLPKVCPRCKNKKWNDKKIRPWDKEGYLYIVELKDGIISVGQTTVGLKRMFGYSGVISYVFSKKVKNLNKAEKSLIDKAKEICGNPIEGREYFRGNQDNIDLIISFIKENYGLLSEIDDDTESFDLTKIFCMWAIENKKPLLIASKKKELIDAKNYMLLIADAFKDASLGVCTYQKAIDSLIGIFTKNFMSIAEEYKNLINMDITTNHDDIVHEVIDSLNQ